MSSVEVLDEDGVALRREAILKRVGVSEDDLRERGQRYALTAGELAALDELEALDYLRHGPSGPA